jgi:hypothetical protein
VNKKLFATLGIKVNDGQVSTWGLTSRPLGRLAGAEAQLSDSTRHRRIGGPVSATVLTAPVLGPLALVGMLGKKSKAFAFVVFPDGTVHEKKLDGNMAIRNAQREVVQFNAMARAADLGGATARPTGRPTGTCPGCGEPIEKTPEGRFPFVHTATGDFACPKNARRL